MQKETHDDAWARLAPLVGVIGFLFLFRIPLLLLRDFDPDELQHLHGGFCVATGLVPFEDYFDHHPPWLTWVLGLVYRVGGPEWHTLLLARALMAAVCGGILWLSYRIWSEVAGRRTAVIAAAFLSGTLLFVQKSLEVRPDVPATLLWLLGLRAVIGATRTGRLSAYGLAGAAFGSALMFTPKLSFGVLGVGVGLVLWAVRRDGPSGGGRVLRGLVAMGLAACVPLLLTLAALGITGGLGGFLEDVVILSLHWERELPAAVHLGVFIEQNPFLALLGAAGTLRLLGVGFLGRAPDPAAAVVGSAAALLTLGWFVVPVPWPQYLLPLTPLWAWAAASLCAEILGLRADGAPPWRTASGWVAVLAVLGVAAVASLDLRGYAIRANLEVTLSMAACASLVAIASRIRGRGRLPVAAGALALSVVALELLRPLPSAILAPWVLLLLWVLLARRGEQPMVLAVAVLMAAPLSQIAALRSPSNDAFRGEFEFIMRQTDPSDTVLTSWRGCAVFRPHAYHYYFLHPGMRRMLTEQEKGEDVLRLLLERPPAAVIRDEGVLALSAEVNAYLSEHYRPTGHGAIWIREPAR